MRHFTIKKRKTITAVFLSAVLLGTGLATPIQIKAESKVKTQSKLSYGVDYKNIDYTAGSTKAGVDVMEVNISDPYTAVQLGRANPLDKLATVRARATSYNQKYNQIIGAINANFFLATQGKVTRPVHLISEDNRLVYAGYVNTDKNQYVNEPIAFGINQAGKGLIDHYNLNLTYTFNGKTRKISHTNRERAENNTILYTSDFYKTNTDTNQYGTEVVLKGPENMELTLGTTLELKVDSIRKEGDTKTIPISDNYFVLSGHGTASTNLQGMKIGDTVKINVGMDQQWQGSEFMIAGGPQLVKNGNVDISMNTTSWLANAPTSRTAVGIDSTNGKVFFVTADTTYNKGLSIPELAQLMKDLGADTALNLDGGGSTTMAIRPKNSDALKVVNKLQDGFERGVSGVLMAADTEPERIFSDVSYREDLYPGIQWAKDKGAIKGYSDNTFRPYQGLSRKHGAVMFASALSLQPADPTTTSKLFTDVPATHDYAPQIGAVAQAGIFKGSNHQFNPEKILTREQMATTLVKAFGLNNDGLPKAEVNLSNVDPSHRANVQILADNGITTQTDDFRPLEAVTRGQFAVFLQKVSEIR
ncbi:phosphodiester glycosidase family protein [Aciduricibacillus chroicocephali]|uniref:Phosphodiester glycosidase family protein n=1 Tax=Aciduricibacillus chroicocephali TaxID=3054939 RepID=A0ABY9KVV2_9BACI|nr:phosphodiester glycosidase family protein [Bacillaceae bacterium 44XB]